MPCICILYITGDVFLIRKHKKTVIPVLLGMTVFLSSLMISAMNTRSVSPVLVSACPHPSGVNVTSPAFTGRILHCRHNCPLRSGCGRLTFFHDVHGNQGTPRFQSHFRVSLHFSIHLFSPRICLISTCPFHRTLLQFFLVHSYHLVWIFLLLLCCITRQIPRLQNQNVTFFSYPQLFLSLSLNARILKILLIPRACSST